MARLLVITASVTSGMYYQKVIRKLARIHDMTELQAAQARLKARKPSSGASKAQDFMTIATATLNASKDTVQLKQKQAEEREAELKESKTALYLENFRKMLPLDYQTYIDQKTPKHEGNKKALSEIAKLDKPSHLHIFGDSGTAKSHLVVSLAAYWIKTFSVGVRWYSGVNLIKAFEEREHVDLTGPDVLIIDDIDKIRVTDFTAQKLWEVYQRLEHKPLVTTANHRNLEIVLKYISDEADAKALKSRMSYMLELEVRGSDYRPKRGKK
jgi:DNA replication protein DnaC